MHVRDEGLQSGRVLAGISSARLLKYLSRPRFEWFSHFQRIFVSECKEESGATGSQCRRLFYAFDLSEANAAGKAYFFPEPAAMAGGITTVQALVRTIESAPHCTKDRLYPLMLFQAWAEEHQNKGLEVPMLGIDLLDPSTSRLKIYYRSRATTFESVIDCLTLGGRIGRPWIPEVGLEHLRRLWDAILDIDSATGSSLRHVRHETAGVLYDVAFRLGDVVPTTKVYIPVRHYARSDAAVIDGLGRYLKDVGHDKHFPDFVHAIESVFDTGGLLDRRGVQTYLGVQINPDGSLRVVSYFNPQTWKMVNVERGLDSRSDQYRSNANASLPKRSD
jgi:DMATS type aromatic prenyltransferase